MVRTTVPEPKRWLQDHDAYQIYEIPPTPDLWYVIFHEQDVRHLFMRIIQENDETDVKIVQIRWTIDGNIYYIQTSLPDDAVRFVHRNYQPSTGGTLGLSVADTAIPAGCTADKRGLDYKVEIRMTSAIGTNQYLLAGCVIETLEVT